MRDRHLEPSPRPVMALTAMAGITACGWGLAASGQTTATAPSAMGDSTYPTPAAATEAAVGTENAQIGHAADGYAADAGADPGSRRVPREPAMTHPDRNRNRPNLTALVPPRPARDTAVMNRQTCTATIRAPTCSSAARFLAGLAAACAAITAMPLAAQAPAPEPGWISLFNGKNLDGWIPKIRHYPAGENFGNTFRVEDGLLTVSYDAYDDFDGRYGHLFYEQPFSYYRLRVEYRFIGEQAPGGADWARRNSGAMLHSQPPESMPIEQDFPISLELQMLGGLSDGNARPTANLCTPGTNVVYQGEFTTQHCMNSTSPTFDGDQWVTVEALVLGSERIVHYVNGEQVIEYTSMTTGGGSVSGFDPAMKPDGEPRGEGYISLQSESHPVQFRRVELLNLKGCMDPSSPSYRDWYLKSDPDSCR